MQRLKDWKVPQPKSQLVKTNIGEYLIPSVVINLKNESIISIPCMVGCPLGCSFCISKNSFIRMLTSREMVKVFTNSLKVATHDNVKLSFSGEGEPLLNIPEINKTIRNLEGFYSSVRISTSGQNTKVLNKIYCKLDYFFELQISYHTPFQSVRDRIMPLSDSLHNIVHNVNTNKGIFSQITLNYITIPDVNDDPISFASLSQNLMQGWIIKFNPMMDGKTVTDTKLNQHIWHHDNKQYKFNKVAKEINEFYDELTYERI